MGNILFMIIDMQKGFINEYTEDLVEKILIICEVLGVSPYELLSGTG